jgi:hypothetical protein
MGREASKVSPSVRLFQGLLLFLRDPLSLKYGKDFDFQSAEA